MKYGVGLACAVMLSLASAANAGNALDKPAFTATPTELLAAAKTVAPGDWPVVVLRDETEVSLDEQGRGIRRWRFVFVVQSQAGVDDWGVLSSRWSPYYQDKPTVRGRVIAPDGTVASFDPKLVTDAPAVEKSPSVFSDERTLEVPLPRLVVGAVVEEELVTRDRVPLLASGVTKSVWLGSEVPTQSSRVVISAPVSRKAKLVARALPKGAAPKRVVSKGRETWTLGVGALPPNAAYEPLVPGDVLQQPMISIATGASWNAVAREYRALLDRRIADGPFSLPTQLPRTPTIETVRAIVAWLHAQIRYTGIEYGEASIIPWPPVETAKRGFGDCKDKATLLVTLLRQAGIHADLALLRTGPDIEIDPELVGMGWFDHAIVRAKLGTMDVWIDATEDLVVPGALPARDQGRRALIISDDTTALVTTPVSHPRDNIVREVRTFTLAELGDATVTEVSSEGGVFSAGSRSWIRDARGEDVRSSLATYVERQFSAKALASYTSTPPTDLAKPFELTLVARNAGAAYTDRDEIRVNLFPNVTLNKVPAWLKAKPDDKAAPRRHDFEWHQPHIYEVENRLVLPPGFTAPTLPADRVRDLGPAKLTERHRHVGNTVTVTFTFDSGPRRVAAKDVTAMQRAMHDVGSSSTDIVIENTASSLAARGTFVEALREVERLIALHPKESLHRSQLAGVLLRAGAGQAARREARKAVQLEPKNADAHQILAFVLRHDTLGRELGFDHDRAGALAAYARARALDPTHVGAAVDHATMLQVGTDGMAFGPGADAKAALAAWRAAYALDASTDNARGLIRMLLWTGLGAEAEKVARDHAASEDRDAWLVAATSVVKDTTSAVAVAASLRTGAARTQLLEKAASFLVGVRRYDPARELMSHAGARTNTRQAELIQRLRPASARSAGRDPKPLAIEVGLAAVDPRYTSPAVADEDYAKELRHAASATAMKLAPVRAVGGWFIEDIIASTLDTKVEGRADGPWRLVMDIMGKGFTAYAILDRGTAKVIGGPEALRGLGRYALALLAKRDEAGARQLLDWALADIITKAGKDPTSGVLEKVWSSTTTGKDAMQLAAAVLANGADAAHTVPILTRCATTIAGGRDMCDLVLAGTLVEAKRWKDLEAHTRGWLQRVPSPPGYARFARLTALLNLRPRDAEKFLDEVAASKVDENFVLAMRPAVLAATGDVDGALRAFDTVIKSPIGSGYFKNNAAWLRLAHRRDLPLALEYARAAVREREDAPTMLNTLAVAEAEAGNLQAAREQGYRAMEIDGRVRPTAPDWYLVGRMLEQLGQRKDAIAAYRAIRPEPASMFPTAFSMARDRLKALGVAP